MDDNIRHVEQQKLERTRAALEKNNMEAYIVDTAADVVPLLATLIRKEDVVSTGGSVTLNECGVPNWLREEGYCYLDREAPGMDLPELYRKVFSADVYLASANAVTEEGGIYEMDGRGNRVAAIAYGPASVILVAGRNKIVPNLKAARRRRAHVAGPANSRRVGARTPCATTGLCVDCESPGRICCTELTLYRQLAKGRIKVVLVNEELGY